MELLITEQYPSYVACMNTGGKNTWSKGEITLTTVDDFLSWLAGTEKSWSMCSDVETRKLIIVHHNHIGVDTQRTTLECGARSYDTMNQTLWNLLLSETH